MDDLRVGDPLVVLWVYSLEKSHDLRVNVLIKGEETTFYFFMHSLQQLLELQFVQYTKRFLINSLELSRELTEESLMLTELVLKDCV